MSKMEPLSLGHTLLLIVGVPIGCVSLLYLAFLGTSVVSSGINKIRGINPSSPTPTPLMQETPTPTNTPTPPTLTPTPQVDCITADPNQILPGHGEYSITINGQEIIIPTENTFTICGTLNTQTP